MKKVVRKFGHGLGDSKGELLDLKRCEEMAADGYRLKKINHLGFWIFERDTPETVEFSMDIAKFKKKSPEFEDYKELFDAAGWTYVLSYEDFHFFKAIPGTKPIYSDPESHSEKYNKLKKDLLIGGILMFIIGLLGYIGLLYIMEMAWLHFALEVLIGGFTGGLMGVGGLCIYMGYMNHKRASMLRCGEDGAVKSLMDSVYASDYEGYLRLYRKAIRNMVICITMFIIIVLSFAFEVGPDARWWYMVRGGLGGFTFVGTFEYLYKMFKNKKKMKILRVDEN